MENEVVTPSPQIQEPLQTLQPQSPLKTPETHESLQTPAYIRRRLYVDHLGVALSNVAIFMMILCIVGLIGQVVVYITGALLFLMAAALLVVAAIATLGIAFVFPGYGEAWAYVMGMMEDVEAIASVFDAFYSILPFYSAAMLLISLGSVFCVHFNKSFRHPVRKVVGIITAALAVVVFIFTVAGGTLWTN